MKCRISATTAVAMFVASLIGACGGGGGSSSPPVTQPPSTNPGAKAPGVSVSPSLLAFAAQTVVSPAAAQVITVSNTGTAALSVGAVTVTGTNAAGFSQTNTCASSVAPGGTCAISVTFAPTVAGVASAAINIASNAPTSPTTVAVSGALTVLNFSTFQPASVAIGVPDLITPGSPLLVSATTLNVLTGNPAVSPSGTLYAPDFGNNRILGFNSVPGSSGASADFVLGQNNFGFNLRGTTQRSVFSPFTTLVYNNHLIVADSTDSRILIWNSLPVSTGVLPDVVLGQPDFTTTAFGCGATALNGPDSLAIVNGNLAVADTLNNRVLIYKGIPAVTNAAAVTVLGQANLTTCAITTSATPTTMNSVVDVGGDGFHLLAVDRLNNRVLIWNTTDPTTLAQGQAADMVLGQVDFTSNLIGTTAASFFNPAALSIDAFSGRLAIADSINNRVLIWNSVPTCSPVPCSISTASDVVLGQINFTSSVPNAAPGTGMSGGFSTLNATGLYMSNGVHFNGPNQLIVVDMANDRDLIYNAH